MPTARAMLALAYLADGSQPRRLGYCPLGDVPGGPDAVADLILSGLVVLWDRSDGLAVALTPIAAHRLALEFDETWVSFPRPRLPDELAGEVPDKEWVEVPAWHPSPVSSRFGGDPVPCWAHGVVQLKEVGIYPLLYPDLIPCEPEPWYLDEDGSMCINETFLVPPPSPVLDDWGRTLAIGDAVAFREDDVRAYRKSLAMESRARAKAKKAAKIRRPPPRSQPSPGTDTGTENRELGRIGANSGRSPLGGKTRKTLKIKAKT